LRASTSVAYRNPEMIEESGASRFWRGDKWLRSYTADGGLSLERALSGEIALVIQNAFSDHYTDYNEDFINKRHVYLTATLEF
jgi:hypothetical protein